MILVRIAGAALIVAAETLVPPNITLFNAAYIMDFAGLAALLFSSLGFIGMA
jgi:hypothetical protein